MYIACKYLQGNYRKVSSHNLNTVKSPTAAGNLLIGVALGQAGQALAIPVLLAAYDSECITIPPLSK